MRRLLLHCVLICHAPLALLAADPPDFAAAESAYKAGSFEQAAALYEQALAGGWEAPALHFNLGNARFKQDRIGEAVLHYRRAWTLAPRDPDIKANMRFAQQRTEALGPDLTLPAQALTTLTSGEWAGLAITAYWLAAGLWIVQLLRRGHPVLARLAVVSAGIGVSALAGLGQWWMLRSSPEVVLRERQQALFGPIAGEKPHFALPEGSIVRELDRNGDWVLVRSGTETGWIPARSCDRVSPWQPARPR